MMMHAERAQRVAFETAIRLVSPDERHAVTGYTENLSESGLFATAPCPFEVGAAVVCEVPLVGDHLRLRGEVIWVQELPGDDGCSPTSAMGIRFVELAPAELAALRRHVVGGQRSATKPVVVHFEGFARPIRAQAVVTESGLQLWTCLPFLRLQSPVNVAFGGATDQPARRGVLDQVELALDQGVPRLQIDVSLAELEQIEQREQWQPGQVIYSTSEPEPPPAAADTATDDAHGATASGTINASAAMPQGATPVQIAQQVVELLPRQFKSPAPQQPDAAPELEAAPEPPALLDPCAESHWSLGQPEDLPEPGFEGFWREAEQRRQRIWRWIAALSMAGVAVASMIQTNLWEQVSQRLWPRAAMASSSAPAGAAGALTVEIAPASTAAATKPAAVIPAPVQPAVQATTAATATTATAAATAKNKTARADKQRQLEVLREGAVVTLRVPISGSTREMQHYLLANPDGVAVNAPHARQQQAFGHYAIDREGIRAVWLRERLGGLQVRVFFAGPAQGQPQVRFDQGQLEIRIDAASAPQ